MLESLLPEALRLLLLPHRKENSNFHKSSWSDLLLSLHQHPVLELCCVPEKSFFHMRSRSHPAPTGFLRSFSEEKAANGSGLMLVSERGSPNQILTLPLQTPWCSFQWKLIQCVFLWTLKLCYLWFTQQSVSVFLTRSFKILRSRENLLSK